MARKPQAPYQLSRSTGQGIQSIAAVGNRGSASRNFTSGWKRNPVGFQSSSQSPGGGPGLSRPVTCMAAPVTGPVLWGLEALSGCPVAAAPQGILPGGDGRSGMALAPGAWAGSINVSVPVDRDIRYIRHAAGDVDFTSQRISADSLFPPGKPRLFNPLAGSDRRSST